MSCSSCLRHVESALREREGIAQGFEVNLKDGLVDRSRPKTEQMIQALDEAGYGARNGANPPRNVRQQGKP